jgi:hypothetical protein
MPQSWRETIRAVNKVLNETDVYDLHRACLVAQAGEFYREIFLAYFQRYNLGYDMPHREFPGIQATMPAIVWRMDTEVRDWTPVAGLASRILLPVPLCNLQDATTDDMNEDSYLVGYVTYPRYGMGLLETDVSEGSPFGIREENRNKTTGLWRKVLWFD